MFPLKPSWPRVTPRRAKRRPEPGDLGCPSVLASLEQPRALPLSPWHARCGAALTRTLTLTGDTPTPSSGVPGAGPSRTQLRALPRRGPNKSLAFNYSSGLILMQLPGGGGRAGGVLGRPWSFLSLGRLAAGALAGKAWGDCPGKRWGDASPPTPARLRLLSPGGGARRQMGSGEGGSESLPAGFA